MNVSEERKITAGTISGATFKSIDIEPSIIVDGKSYTASEFNKAVEMLKQPQLNENQQIVLDGLKFIFVNYNQEFGTDDNIKYALRDFYWYLGTDYSISENKKIVSMCESYDLLSAD